jgi:hypothetical protein
MFIGFYIDRKEAYFIKFIIHRYTQLSFTQFVRILLLKKCKQMYREEKPIKLKDMKI